jgi:vesicle coat complex subunit
MMLHFHKKDSNQGGNKYFQNSRNAEVTELQDGLNSMKIEKQKDAMKQIIASMTIGKDVSMLFPQVVKCIRTKNIELKKLVYLYLINYAKVKPDLTFLAVASFNQDAKEGETPLIRGLAIRTMGCIRVPMIVSYLCETLTWCFKDNDAYVRKTAALCVAKLYMTSSQLVRENGFIQTLHDCLKDSNAIVIANSMSALNEISILSGVNQLQIKSKVLKRILEAIPQANEWGQVSILDALILYNPKKPSHAEEVIEGVLPRLNHTNPSVVMSAIKVILKFMDHIDNIDKVRNYCKKISNSLMSVMMASPEIQYVLLRALRAIVQKRPMLLDKDFKFFFVQYNDPIYVKLEKVDILYKLCDNKNFEAIIKEFTSYALTEINPELIHKSVKYIGFIGYKYEKSVDLCVDSLGKIIDNNNDEAITESIIVARDLMRKYKGRALELIKKITIDLIQSMTDPNAKSAAFYIVGEFCTMIPKSTEIISHFVHNFSDADIVSKIKLQILNAAVKNFVNKPDEGEDIVKLCLQKGAEESENPDVRDRAYIYWRLLETDPDIAKDMMVSEKPPFDFSDDDNMIDSETVDDLIDNMTNVSAVYLKKGKEMINEEDMILDTAAEGTVEESPSKKKEEKKEKVKEEKHRTKKKEKKKEVEQVQNAMDADLLGLDEDVITSSNPNPIQPNVVNQPSNNNNQNNNPMGDIFSIFNTSSNPQTSNNNQNNNNMGIFDFGSMGMSNTNVPNTIFQNNTQFPTTPIKNIYTGNGITIYSQFQRANNQVSLGLYFQSQNPVQQCQLMLNKNSFGLSTIQGNNLSQINNNCAFFNIINDNNNNDMKPPSYPFMLDAMINYGGNNINVKIPVNLIAMFIEGFKLSGNPFVQFFQSNKDHPFNSNEYIYNNQNNEDRVKELFEKNNIVLSARQNKANPPTAYFSANICGGIPILIEVFMKNGVITVKIIANHEAIVPLVKEAIDNILA